MKKYSFLVFIFFITNFSMQAQFFENPRIYAGLDAFRSPVFGGEEWYSGIYMGSEVFRYKFIAPEIEIGYYYGAIEKNESYGIDKSLNGSILETIPNVVVAYTSGGYNAFMFSIGSKLIIGNDGFSFFILPRYNFASIKAHADYNVLDDKKQRFNIVESDENKSTQSAFSIGIGFESDVFKSERMSVSLMVIYSLLNIENAFEGIDVKGLRDNQITGAAGLGLRFYFNPFIKK